MTTFLIDADIVAFKAATAAETPIEWEDGLWTLHGYASDAQFYCENYFADLLSEHMAALFPKSWEALTDG